MSLWTDWLPQVNLVAHPLKQHQMQAAQKALIKKSPRKLAIRRVSSVDRRSQGQNAARQPVKRLAASGKKGDGMTEESFEMRIAGEQSP
jgi:hypothetical protein